MNAFAKNVWHILAKDWRLVWIPVTAIGVVQIAAGIAAFFIRPSAEFSGLIYLLRTVALAGCLLPVTELVRQDVIFSDRKDWLIRPVPRLQMLAAKIAGLLLMVHGPRFVGDWLSAFAGGSSAVHAFGIALLQGAMLLIAFTSPWMACASLFTNAYEMLTTSVILSIAFIFVESRGIYGREWLLQYAFTGFVLLAAAATLIATYLRRNALLTRWALLSVVFLAVLAGPVLSPTIMGLQSRFSSAVDADSIVWRYDPQATQMSATRGIRVTGVPAGERLEVEAVFARSANKRVFAAAPSFTATKRLGGDFVFEQYLAPAPEPIELTYYAALLRPSTSESFPVALGPLSIRGAGRCEVAVRNQGSLSLECLEESSIFTCYTLAAEFPQDRSQDKSMDVCQRPDQPPLKYRWGLSALVPRFMRIEFNFRDPDGQPILYDDARLRGGRFLLTAYESAGTIVRRVTIPAGTL